MHTYGLITTQDNDLRMKVNIRIQIWNKYYYVT